VSRLCLCLALFLAVGLCAALLFGGGAGAVTDVEAANLFGGISTTCKNYDNGSCGTSCAGVITGPGGITECCSGASGLVQSTAATPGFTNEKSSSGGACGGSCGTYSTFNVGCGT
jgi:hypothetical protein